MQSFMRPDGRWLALCLLVACGGHLEPIDPPSPPAPIARGGHVDCRGGDDPIFLLGPSFPPNPPRLFRFSPRTLSLETVGAIPCDGGGRAWSMAVDRNGVAYVELADVMGRSKGIARVRTSDATCIDRSYEDREHALGMAFLGDRLFALDERSLHAVDPITFDSTIVGSTGALGFAELTATGDDRLFAFAHATAQLAEIDARTGSVVRTIALGHTDEGGTFAVAAWGGDFYLFSGRTVGRWEPARGAYVHVTELPTAVIGAGAIACP
jgi:hypothetical protein